MSSPNKIDFEDVRQYFTVTEWRQLANAEKERYCNIRNNHLFMKSIGLKSPTPAFMERSRSGHVRLPVVVSSSSRGEDDPDWSPCLERQGPRVSRCPTRGTIREDGGQPQPRPSEDAQAEEEELPFTPEERPASAVESNDNTGTAEKQQQQTACPQRKSGRHQSRGRNLRDLRRVNYREEDVPEDDHYYC